MKIDKEHTTAAAENWLARRCVLERERIPLLKGCICYYYYLNYWVCVCVCVCSW